MSQRGGADLAAAIAQVVDAGNCSGCGACAQVADTVSLRLDDAGYLRPQVAAGSGVANREAVAEFRAICPGVEVKAPATPTGGKRHPTMGVYLQAWQAWASDPQLRYVGSSGGVLTALNQWLLSTGEVSAVQASRADSNPRHTVPVRLLSGAEAEQRRASVNNSAATSADVAATAGSRYAPHACAACPAGVEGAAVAKPCGASALRALAQVRGEQAPLLLSFFCAGTPSQTATDELVAELSGGQPVADLWYRGHGWPGQFTVTTADGEQHGVDYEQSWGRRLGPTVQWRCKICVDGVGEAADVVAADFWESDANGYPIFAEDAGRSALIARTPRGLDLVRRALAAGVLEAEPLDLDALAAVQPLQTSRRELLAARLTGVAASGRAIPRYRGFSLIKQTLRSPRQAWRTAKGTYRRSRRLG